MKGKAANGLLISACVWFVYGVFIQGHIYVSGGLPAEINCTEIASKYYIGLAILGFYLKCSFSAPEQKTYFLLYSMSGGFLLGENDSLPFGVLLIYSFICFGLFIIYSKSNIKKYLFLSVSFLAFGVIADISNDHNIRLDTPTWKFLCSYEDKYELLGYMVLAYVATSELKQLDKGYDDIFGQYWFMISLAVFSAGTSVVYIYDGLEFVLPAVGLSIIAYAIFYIKTHSFGTLFHAMGLCILIDPFFSKVCALELRQAIITLILLIYTYIQWKRYGLGRDEPQIRTTA